MAVPQVVIIGRPNVGKSSLLNWLSGIRIAIVEDRPGVTRDRVEYLMEYEERFFELVDTGGIGITDDDNLTKHIEVQIQTAIDSASVILFIVDTRTGLTPLDEEVARRLRNLDVPVICIANKSDTKKLDEQAADFYRLGRGQVVPVSTQQNRGRETVLDMVLERLPPECAENESQEEPEMRVAIVGRRNVGKSTFVNTLVDAQRMIVSEVAGTTRDSVDVRFELDGKAFVAIDTPGIRRPQGRKSSSIDFYGFHRAQRSIRRADVVFLFLDATQRISKIDKQLCGYISENYKPCIIVVNKWDTMADAMPTEKWVTYLTENFPTMRYAPIAFITGETGKNVKALLNHGQMLFKQSRHRISTGQLNRLLREAIRSTPPPLYQNRRPKIYYGTQVGIQPPTLVLFCNSPAGIAKSYQRYLLSSVRDQLNFEEVPIKLYLRKRTQTDQRDEIKSDNPTAKAETRKPKKKTGRA